MTSFLDKVWNEKTQKYEERGMYDPRKRYGFKNITEESFTFSWNSNPITVQAGTEIELPEHMAILATHKLVDQIMSKIAHDETLKLREKTGDFTSRSPMGASIGIPHARKIWEDKIIRELKIDERSPEYQVLRAQTKEQIINDLTNAQKPADPIESAVAGFSQMGNPKAPSEFSEIPNR